VTSLGVAASAGGDRLEKCTEIALVGDVSAHRGADRRSSLKRSAQRSDKSKTLGFWSYQEDSMERPRRSPLLWRRETDGRLVTRFRAWVRDTDIPAHVAATGEVLATLVVGPRQRKFVPAEVRMRSCQR
jgi:hypothetical protein